MKNNAFNALLGTELPIIQAQWLACKIAKWPLQ